MKVLLLDERYPPELLAGFEVVRTPQEDVVGVLTIGQPMGAELFAQLPALRVVATATVGFDHIDIDAAEEHGVAVVSVPDYCTQEVADHALALLLGLVRGVVALDRDVRRGGWDAKAAGPLRTLAELRVGIVGLGRIGGALATRLLALDAEVWGHDVFPVARDGVRFVELEELLAECDAVTLHVPLTRETRGLIGRAQIAVMKPDALLVNTSRGAVVDVGAVLEALRAGRLGGAALDVLPQEPPPVAPLAPNLVLTPHAAYYSEAAEERSVRLAVARMREILGA
ncbi:MAG: C-terminal binding protein [Actinomycetota bacterium]|nr:C-terminal binding protein [Actinomycetota bacterium]